MSRRPHLDASLAVRDMSADSIPLNLMSVACACSIAMKRNPVTGEMEEFHSHALQDDLPDEEAETAEVELPVGDDY